MVLTKIIHLQLNTAVLRDPKAIMGFMLEHEVDIACLQEVAYPINDANPLSILAQENDYYYREGIHFQYMPHNKNIGVAILSKFPVIDTTRIYFNSENYRPKKIDNTDVLGEIVEDTEDVNIPGSRGIKHAVKSRCIMSCLLDINGKELRVVTTHFTVSDLCTETLQMFEMAKIVSSFVKYAEDCPTLFSADLNLRAQSYSVKLLEEEMELHTRDLTNTLANSHIALKKDFPEGLAIDHVFSKHLDHVETKPTKVDFSEHKALLSRFSL